jgi:serine/threonine protein kinase
MIIPIGRSYEMDIAQYISKGQFGSVYLGKHRVNGDRVAIKLEMAATMTAPSLLKHESMILHYLYSKSCQNIPCIRWYGDVTANFHHGGQPTSKIYALVIPYYSMDLTTFITTFSQGDKHKMGALIRQFLVRAQSILLSIHEQSVIHRDIKPDNWMMQVLPDGNHKLILIDFGLATFFSTTSTSVPISNSPTTIKHIIGSPFYTSWYIHQLGSNAYQCRDDVMSMLYVALSFVFGQHAMWQQNLRQHAMCQNNMEQQNLWQNNIGQHSMGQNPQEINTPISLTNILHPFNQHLSQEKSFSCVQSKLQNIRPHIDAALWQHLIDLAEELYRDHHLA